MRKIVWVILLFFYADCYSQSGWQWVNPYPSNKNLRNTQFVNHSTGFTIIDYKLFKTTNGGLNWIIPGDTTDWLYYKFINESTGITTSSIGLRKTTNSGVNWFFYSSGGGELDLLDITTVFYTFTIYSPFGPFGHIAVTTNSGVNWFNPYYPEPQYFSGIRILSPYNAYALGQDSIGRYLYKSFGPASSWFRIPLGFNFSSTPGLFVKDSLTLFISSNYTILSTNGGYNWGITELGDIKDIKFFNANTGIATGFNHQIFRSTNGGFNWIQIQSPVDYDFNSISIADASTAYITGNLGSVLKSTDFGQNWSTNCHNFTIKNLNDFCLIGKDTLIIVADSGHIFRTSNQGLNWQTSVYGYRKKFRKIFFCDKSTGYAIGDSGTLVKTTNCGINWNVINLAFNDYFMLDVFFLNQNTGFICTGGNTGNIYKSTNGGLNWITLPRPDPGRYFFIRFLDQNTGFASCWEKIYRTTNLGENWTQMNTNVNSQLHYDICFINNLTGFTAGGDGYIHKTTDAGFNWIRTSKLVYSDVFRVKFLNEQTGYATAGYGTTGSNGSIFSTTNGGDNWTKQYIPMGTNGEKLSAINFSDINTGFVVGEGGIVFKTTTGGFVFTKKIEEIIPFRFSLLQNYPNPFNPTTKIKFDIPVKSVGQTFLSVYDMLGREVHTLVNEQLQPGTYEVTFDGSNLPSGVYFYQLRTGEFTATKKLILLK